MGRQRTPARATADFPPAGKRGNLLLKIRKTQAGDKNGLGFISCGGFTLLGRGGWQITQRGLGDGGFWG